MGPGRRLATQVHAGRRRRFYLRKLLGRRRRPARFRLPHVRPSPRARRCQQRRPTQRARIYRAGPTRIRKHRPKRKRLPRPTRVGVLGGSDDLAELPNGDSSARARRCHGERSPLESGKIPTQRPHAIALPRRPLPRQGRRHPLEPRPRYRRDSQTRPPQRRPRQILRVTRRGRRQNLRLRPNRQGNRHPSRGPSGKSWRATTSKTTHSPPRLSSATASTCAPVTRFIALASLRRRGSANAPELRD